MPSDFADKTDSIEFNGIYHDGRTPSDRKVSVKLLDKNLELLLLESGKKIIWDYSRISSSGLLAPGRPAHIGNADTPDERLFIKEKLFADALLLKCPRLSIHRRNRIVFAIAGLVTAVSIVVTTYIFVEDVSPTQLIVRMMPDQVRSRLGDTIVNQIINDRRLCTNEKGANAFKILVDRLTTHNDIQTKFEIYVAKLGVVNAFATPGSRIIISDKLIKFVKSPEELAGILAHEMGHGIAMHPETGIVRAAGFSLGLQLLLGGSTGNIGDAGLLLLQLKYTRTAEQEADNLALEILKKSHIDSRKFSNFFSRIVEYYSSEKKQTNQQDSSLFDEARLLFRTHPPTERRADMFARAPTWPHLPILTATEWVALKNICADPNS